MWSINNSFKRLCVQLRNRMLWRKNDRCNTKLRRSEKHKPTYEKVEDEVFVKVNHVMEKEHYIEWIALVTDNKQCIHKLYPEQNAEVRFKYIPGSTIYAYCNKHGLWKTEVE